MSKPDIFELVRMCPAVYTDADTGAVPVAPGPEIHTEGDSYGLWEYCDVDGAVRACLLRVDAGMSSPRWEIKPDAGDGEYYESHFALSGIGSLVIFRPDAEYPDAVTTEVVDLSEAGYIEVRPGDSFTVLSEVVMVDDSTPPFGEDAYVLATFPGAPFKPEYEQII